MISSFTDTVGFDGHYLRGEFLAEIEYETEDGEYFEIIGLKVTKCERCKIHGSPMMPTGDWKDASFLLDLLDRDEMDGLIDAARDDHDGRTMGDMILAKPDNYRPLRF